MYIYLCTSAEKYRIHAFQVLLLCNNSWNSCDLTLECERCQKPNTMKIGLLTLALLGRPCYCLHNDPFVCKSRQRRASKVDFFKIVFDLFFKLAYVIAKEQIKILYLKKLAIF